MPLALPFIDATQRIERTRPKTRDLAHLLEQTLGPIERGDTDVARRLLREARREVSRFPRAAVLRAQIAAEEGQNELGIRLLRTALHDAPQLMHEQLPVLLRLAGPDARDALLGDLVAQAQSRDVGELKRLVFAAISAGLTDAAPLRGAIESVFAEDATLQEVWRSSAHVKGGPGDARRVAHEIGALLAHAEKFRCSECGFAGRNFYWHCPACHAWDTLEAHAIVKLG
jgi:lipopolysaccharide biosynthesis regulator YciM